MPCLYITFAGIEISAVAIGKTYAVVGFITNNQYCGGPWARATTRDCPYSDLQHQRNNPFSSAFH
jgi:hypothetical protein